MKIRTGFVSNSSSSSFIVKDKEKQEEVINLLKSIYGADYIMHNDTLYTSFIHDSTKEYGKLCELSDDDISGNDTPYDPEDFVEVEGMFGINSVWLDKQYLSDQDLLDLGCVPVHIAERLYRYVKSGINSSDKKLFYETCMKIVEGDFGDYDE